MKWLEIIEIRTSHSLHSKLESNLKSLMQEVNTQAEGQVCRIYTQATLDTDVSIHLTHGSGTVEEGGSNLGLRIANYLKEFGLVHHSVWFELQNNEQK